VLIDLFLNADKFDTYECILDTQIAVNVQTLFNILHATSKRDLLTMSLYNAEFLTIQIDTEDKQKIYEVKLIEPDHVILTVPSVQYECVFVLNSNDIRSIIKDLTDVVCVSVENNYLKFKSEYEFGSTQISLQIKVSQKKLLTFMKFTGLSPSVELSVGNSLPLRLNYATKLGTLSLCLKPQ
jgi:Proliferating cell nuclear antigen, N-terminal domain/Proliferating cell nuclear antigen, C-terminal domain